MRLWPLTDPGTRGGLIERAPRRQPMSAVETTVVMQGMLTIAVAEFSATHPEFIASPWVLRCAWGVAIAVGLAVAWGLARQRNPLSFVLRTGVAERAVFVMAVAAAIGVGSWWLLARAVPEQVLERWSDVRVESGVVADLTEIPGRKGCRTFVDVRTPSFAGTISRCVEPILFHRLAIGQAVAVDVQSGAPGRQAGTFRFDLGRDGGSPGGPNP